MGAEVRCKVSTFIFHFCEMFNCHFEYISFVYTSSGLAKIRDKIFKLFQTLIYSGSAAFLHDWLGNFTCLKDETNYSSCKHWIFLYTVGLSCVCYNLEKEGNI